jgi:hypothetical protein
MSIDLLNEVSKKRTYALGIVIRRYSDQWRYRYLGYICIARVTVYPIS